MDLLGQMQEMLRTFAESEQGRDWTGIETLAQEPGLPLRFTLTLSSPGAVVDIRITFPEAP